MSIVEAHKQFYRADLENLITSLTGYNSDCEEFQKCLDSIWPLFSRRYPTTNDQDVKEKLLSFSDKFIFHGFPQKAKNVKTLTEVYEKSEYFKEAKWDIVRVLLELSYRPTDDLEDQDPVDLDALVFEEGKIVAPAFDWGEYLKEGWENFVLPDEESSLDLSISDTSFIETEPPTIFEIPQRPQLNLPPVDDKDEELNILRRKQKYADLLLTAKQPEWWNIPNFRDKPRKELYTGRIRPQETFCYNWERIMYNGTQTNLVVTSEYKMIRLLLWILSLPPNTSSPRIKVDNKMYFIKDNISITNLIPSTFKKSVQNRFMTPLKNLKFIIDFIEKVNSFKLLSQKVPNTYIMYANALDSIVNMYRIQLNSIEDEIKKQETFCSLRRLYVALRIKESHWNDIFEFIVSVHNKAVYPEFENVKNWLCSMKLLSVLYDQLETSVNYKKTIVLKLFIESFSSYLEIICLMMAGNFDSDVKQEFVICRKSDINRTLEIRNYYGFVKSFRSGSYDFWKPFISKCHRAISSVYFLKKLKKFHNLSNMRSYDFFVVEFCKRLRSALLMPTEKADELNRYNCLMIFPEDFVNDFITTHTLFGPQTRMYGDSFDRVFNIFRTPSKNIFRKSTLEKLSDDVLDAKLDINMTNSVLKDVSIQMVKDYMLPAGFASSILLDEHKLLDVLRNIRNIYFLNIIQPFSIELFHQIKENQHWTYPWTTRLRNYLNEFHPIEFCDQFNFEIGDSKIQGLIGSSNVLYTLEFVKLNYYPEDFSMLFTDDIIEAYNHLFSFRLQLRYSYCLILALRLKDLKENAQNYEICRSLYSLKMWLLHTMTALYNYFVFIDEKSFDDKIIKACAEAKDLQTIQNAHMEMILMYKNQCFLHGKGCRKDPVLMIFQLCEELSQLWSSTSEGTLKENAIKSLEQKYLTSIESLATMLLNISSPGNVNFSILFNDIVNNMAVQNT